MHTAQACHVLRTTVGTACEDYHYMMKKRGMAQHCTPHHWRLCQLQPLLGAAAAVLCGVQHSTCPRRPTPVMPAVDGQCDSGKPQGFAQQACEAQTDYDPTSALCHPAATENTTCCCTSLSSRTPCNLNNNDTHMQRKQGPGCGNSLHAGRVNNSVDGYPSNSM